MERRTRGLIVALGALALFGMLAAGFGPSEPPTRIPSAPSPLVEAPEVAAVAPASPLPLGPPEARPGDRAHADSPEEVREHPHPITERHRALQHENNLLSLLNESVASRNGERLQDLLREYRLTHPDDPNRLQAGYAVLAECLTNPGETARLEAARYYDTHRASILRRSIRRVCLED